MEKKELKELLLSMRANKFAVPEDINANEFALELLPYLADTDPVLRDELVLDCIWSFMGYRHISQNTINTITNNLLSDEYLFYNISVIESDDVFKRSFSALLLCAVAIHNKEMDFNNVLSTAITYSKTEKDKRGYVINKGWAHTTAHIADLLGFLALNNEANEDSLKRILDTIYYKINDNSLNYVYGEDDRLAKATVRVLAANKLKDEDVLSYIHKFVKHEGAYNEVCNITNNSKNYLNNLYFRLVKAECDEKILSSIKQHVLTLYY